MCCRVSLLLYHRVKTALDLENEFDHTRRHVSFPSPHTLLFSTILHIPQPSYISRTPHLLFSYPLTRCVLRIGNSENRKSRIDDGAGQDRKQLRALRERTRRLLNDEKNTPGWKEE